MAKSQSPVGQIASFCWWHLNAFCWSQLCSLHLYFWSIRSPAFVNYNIHQMSVRSVTLWLFNIAMENPNHKWRFLAGKIIYKWAIFHGELLVITRSVRCSSSTSMVKSRPWEIPWVGVLTTKPGSLSFLSWPYLFPRFTCVLLVNIGHLFSGEYIALTFMTNLHLCISSCDISPISDPSHGPPFAPREVRRCSGTCRALCGQQLGRWSLDHSWLLALMN